MPPKRRRVGLGRQVRPVSGFAARAGACVQKVRAGVHACMFVRRVDAQTFWRSYCRCRLMMLRLVEATSCLSYRMGLEHAVWKAERGTPEV